jgi:hypothetical protein
VDSLVERDAPLRLHILEAMAADFEDWEHVLDGVKETKGEPLDEDAVERELQSLIDQGLVNAFAVVPPGPEGRLRWTEPDRSRLREEWKYWFHPTEAGMRLYCEATGSKCPTSEHALAKLSPPEKPGPAPQ